MLFFSLEKNINIIEKCKNIEDMIFKNINVIKNLFNK